MSNLMVACGGCLKVQAGTEVLLLPSLDGERAKVALFLQWAQDRGHLKFEVFFRTRMPRYQIGGLGWRDCPLINQLPWKLPTPGMMLRYAGIGYGLLSVDHYL